MFPSGQHPDNGEWRDGERSPGAVSPRGWGAALLGGAGPCVVPDQAPAVGAGAYVSASLAAPRACRLLTP